MSNDQREIQGLGFDETVSRLGLSEEVVNSLIDAGFLHESPSGVDEAGVDMFLAMRSGDMHSADTAEDLMSELDDRSGELSRLAYDRFARAIPDAASWNEEQRNLFMEQAEGRFGAILAVMSQGSHVDDELRHDLEEVGASAAWAGTSLPHLLLVLRISRDLLLQTALRLTAKASPALVGAFGARMLPAIDRLTDALADGYWSARLDQQQEEWHRLANLVEGCSYGVYEADLDGIVRYANPTLAAATGVDVVDIVGSPLSHVLKTQDSRALNSLLAEPEGDASQIETVMSTVHGETAVRIDSLVRRVDRKTVGFGGIINFTAEGGSIEFGEGGHATTKADTSAMLPDIEELRRSLGVLVQAGTFLDRNAETMNADRVHQAGKSIRRQSERLTAIVDSLDDNRRNL